MASNGGGKEAYFGGLPESLFGNILTKLQGVAGGGAATEAAAALVALVSLAQEEHAAAASTVQVRQVDAIFRAIEIQAKLDNVVAAGAGSPLVLALNDLTAKLNDLRDFLNGK